MNRRLLPMGAATEQPRRRTPIEPLDLMERRIAFWRNALVRWILRPCYVLVGAGFIWLAWIVIDGLQRQGLLP